MFQLLCQSFQAVRKSSPIIERRLQRGRDHFRRNKARQVARNNGEISVSRTVFDGSEFHELDRFPQ